MMPSASFVQRLVMFLSSSSAKFEYMVKSGSELSPAFTFFSGSVGAGAGGPLLVRSSTISVGGFDYGNGELQKTYA
jgi:hypothetical protein